MSRQPATLLQRIPFGAVLGVLAAVYIGAYLVTTIKHNYDLQQQITTLHQQISNLQVERDKLKYNIQYYQTDAYKEKEARARLNLQAPGEGVILLPHTSDSTATSPSAYQKTAHRSNLQQWLSFLSGNAAK